MGSAAQATVPGAYAWAATVAPVAWSRGGGTVAKVASVVALAALGSGWAGERKWGERARFASLWGFVLACAVTWSAAPTLLSTLRVGVPRGLAGMLGWGLFALALAAPSLDEGRRPATVIEAEPLAMRRRLAPGDSAYVFGAAAIAFSMQLIGWRIPVAERALLVRFVSLAAGLAVIDAGTAVALARHSRRVLRPRRVRLRAPMAAFVMLGMLALAGLLFALRG
jgi:hypothetical protein